MALETGVNFISDLVAANPADGDAASQGDNHIRSIKGAVKNTFPNITGQVTATHQDMNVLSNLTVGATEINYLSGATGNIQTQLDNLDTSFTNNLNNLDSAKLDKTSYTAADVLGKLITVDGSASGVDADLLDGQHGDYYRDAGNLNAGKVNADRLTYASASEADAGVDATKLMTPNTTAASIESRTIGYNQTWQSLKNTRNDGTSYQNTTGRPITVAITGHSLTGSVLYCYISNDNSTWITIGSFPKDPDSENVNTTDYMHATNTIVVPANWYYKTESNVNIVEWAELR